MAKPLIRRICTGVLLTAAIVVAALGVYQTAYRFWARRTCEHALSFRFGADIQRDKLKKMGERAVPLVFAEMRKHPDRDSNQICFGKGLLRTMARDRRLDPNVPYIGSVLRNTSEHETIREAAAYVLGAVWYSAPARQALADRALRDPSAEFRAVCLVELGEQAGERASRMNDWQIHPLVISTLTTASKDTDPRIRLAACQTTAGLAYAARDSGTTLAWAESLLADLSRDPNKQTRESASKWLTKIKHLTGK